MSDQPSKSGLIVSGVLHGALLVVLIVGFTAAPKFDDAAESIPVSTVTQSQFNEIMKGERDAKPAKEPPPETATSATPPAPPTPPTPPTPPPEIKAAEETPPPPPAQTPPPPPPKPAPPAPAPPPKPLSEDASSPPPPPPPPKPAQQEAAPAPPVRPKAPPPDKFKPDAVAKLLEKPKPDETKPQKAYDPNAIAKLIGQSPSPSPTKSTPDTPTAALGLPNQHAARMSPSLAASLDAWLTEAYLNCWTPPPTMPDGDRYVAEVRVSFNADGTLSGQPTLLNPPTDPAWRAHAESAVRAVLKCNPLRVPPQYQPFFEQWRTKTVHFDPQSALG